MQHKRRLLSTSAYFIVMAAMALGLVAPQAASAATPMVAADRSNSEL